MVEREEPAGEDARRACCMVSEVIEEAGLDRETARKLRRQLLQGVMLFCQWQLQRIEETEAAEEAATRVASKPRSSRRPRRVTVE
jgi:hypothetical protein